MSVLTKKFPTILGLIVLVGGLAGSIFLIGQPQNIFPRAAENEALSINPLAANISDRSFSVFWTTDTPIISYMAVNNGNKETEQKINETSASITHFLRADNY